MGTNLKPSERALLERVIGATRRDGALLQRVIFGESRAAIRQADRLLFLGLIERCGHPKIKDGPFPAPGYRATEAGLAEQG